MGMKNNKSGGAKRTMLVVLCCVLAVILAGLLVVTILVNNLLGQVQRPEETTLSSSEIEDFLNDNMVTGTGPVISDEDIDFGTEPTEVIEDNELINILLIGQDARTAASWQKSEVMILCTFNKNAKTVTTTSFLKDMYVQIPGHGNNKLNVAYTIGGMKLLRQTLQENFGVHIDGCVAVNFGGFIKLIDMVGGVEIGLTAGEASYLNENGNWGVTSHNGWNLKQGKNVLSGAQALGYSRIFVLDSEMARTGRQRNVIAALIQQAKKKNLVELYDLAKEAAAMISTDMSDNQIKEYITKVAPLLMDLNLITQRIPADGSYSYQNVESAGYCAVIDFDANRKLLAETLNP